MSVRGIKFPHLACTILGPILFSLYINDMPLACKNTHTQIYADDAVIIASSKTIQETASILTTELINIHKWLMKSHLLLNIKKTVCMYFTKTKMSLTQSGVFLGGEELELVNKFKYLGVTLDSTLSFKSHVNKISKTIKFNLANFKSIGHH